MLESNRSETKTQSDEHQAQQGAADQTITTMTTGPAFADTRFNIPCFGSIHCFPTSQRPAILGYGPGDTLCSKRLQFQCHLPGAQSPAIKGDRY